MPTKKGDEMHPSTPLILIAIGGVAVVVNSYILIDAWKTGAIRDITWTPLPRADDPPQYIYIWCRTLAYLVVGIGLLITGFWFLERS